VKSHDVGFAVRTRFDAPTNDTPSVRTADFTGRTMSKEFKLPDLGEGIHEAQVVNVMIKQGDAVTEDQMVL
jgi:hypothetical protein